MTAFEYLEDIELNLARINASTKNFDLYKEIRNSLKNFNIIDQFSQIKKSEHGDGLAFEIMFFNEEVLHDIVISRTTIHHITVQISSINITEMESAFGESVNEEGEATVTDNLEMKISYGSNLRTVHYITDLKHYSEMSRIRNNILNIIN